MRQMRDEVGGHEVPPHFQRCSDELDDQEDTVEVAGKARWHRQCMQWEKAETLLQVKSALQSKLKYVALPVVLVVRTSDVPPAERFTTVVDLALKGDD